MKNSLVEKPQSLQKEQEWIRATDIANRYPIGKSTVWDWAKKGKLTPIKVSPRVTVFAVTELENLFKYDIREFEEVPTGDKKVRRRRTLKKQAAKSIPKSKKTDNEMIEDYLNTNVEDEDYYYHKKTQQRRKKKVSYTKNGRLNMRKTTNACKGCNHENTGKNHSKLSQRRNANV